MQDNNGNARMRCSSLTGIKGELDFKSSDSSSSNNSSSNNKESVNKNNSIKTLPPLIDKDSSTTPTKYSLENNNNNNNTDDINKTPKTTPKTTPNSNNKKVLSSSGNQKILRSSPILPVTKLERSQSYDQNNRGDNDSSSPTKVFIKNHSNNKITKKQARSQSFSTENSVSLVSNSLDVKEYKDNTSSIRRNNSHSELSQLKSALFSNNVCNAPQLIEALDIPNSSTSMSNRNGIQSKRTYRLTPGVDGDLSNDLINNTFSLPLNVSTKAPSLINNKSLSSLQAISSNNIDKEHFFSLIDKDQDEDNNNNGIAFNHSNISSFSDRKHRMIDKTPSLQLSNRHNIYAEPTVNDNLKSILNNNNENTNIYFNVIVEDEQRACKNDRILQERIQEGMALNRRNDNLGAVMYKFSLWGGGGIKTNSPPLIDLPLSPQSKSVNSSSSPYVESKISIKSNSPPISGRNLKSNSPTIEAISNNKVIITPPITRRNSKTSSPSIDLVPITKSITLSSNEIRNQLFNDKDNQADLDNSTNNDNNSTIFENLTEITDDELELTDELLQKRHGRSALALRSKVGNAKCLNTSESITPVESAVPSPSNKAEEHKVEEHKVEETKINLNVFHHVNDNDNESIDNEVMTFCTHDQSIDDDLKTAKSVEEEDELHFMSTMRKEIEIDPLGASKVVEKIKKHNYNSNFTAIINNREEMNASPLSEFSDNEEYDENINTNLEHNREYIELMEVQNNLSQLNHNNNNNNNNNSNNRSIINKTTKQDVLTNVISDNDGSPLRWKQGELIGEGTFGKVYKGLNERTGQILAVKQLMLFDGSDSDIQDLRKEISIMWNLKHENIVRYLGTAQSNRYLYIILEYISGGSISSMLIQFGAFSESLTKRYTRQILQGVDYLHNKGIIHRDIKGANVLVTESGIAKLADFGCSKQLISGCTNSLEESMRVIKGSIPWMAPEVIKQSGHGRSSDIWSIGATVIEMATGKPPWLEFAANNLAALFHVATSKDPPPIPPHLTPEAAEFLTNCMKIEAKHRLTANLLLSSQFIINQ